MMGEGRIGTGFFFLLISPHLWEWGPLPLARAKMFLSTLPAALHPQHSSQCGKRSACRKQVKKLHKFVKKGSAAKCARRGVKEMVKGLRKGAKELCVIAGDISPIDVITHLPTYCEEGSAEKKEKL
jgi:hypothetical protein